MLTAAGTHTIDFSAAAMRGAQRNPMVSVIIDGGAHDDVEYGSGFAHLREHWALASLRRMYGDRLVMCSAKTLQYQTELLLFVDSSAATPLDTIDWWQWTEGDLAHEVSVIDEEIVSAESEAVGCAFDRELPRRLGVYGPGTDWGYGHRALLHEWTVDSLAAAVQQTWGPRPTMFSTSTPEVVRWPRTANEAAHRDGTSGLETVATAAAGGHCPGPDTGRIAFCGWLFRYDEWHRAAELDDLATLMRLVVHDRPVAGLGPSRWEIRVSQFGERHVTRGADYLGVGISPDRELPAEEYRRLARRPLEQALSLLLTEIRAVRPGLMAALDRHRLFRCARLNQALPQRAIARNRAKVHDDVAHPDLRTTGRTESENLVLARSLAVLVEQMLATDPEVVPVGVRPR
ncbi:hypothetical protein [Rhodococcus zopfii]|uniref:hypothetical protein n=1 Tax=Rhodococcus zopfii TaxID=43772 RepID=UPI003528D684